MSVLVCDSQSRPGGLQLSASSALLRLSSTAEDVPFHPGATMPQHRGNNGGGGGCDGDIGGGGGENDRESTAAKEAAETTATAARTAR